MVYFLWIILGLIAVWPFLWLAGKFDVKKMHTFLGLSLVVTAICYVGFALIWGDTTWLLVESSGVAIYGLFYLLSTRFSMVWLSVGWLLHPVWDAFLHLQGPGSHIAPAWWSVACISFDAAVAGYIVYRIARESRLACSINPPLRESFF